MRIGTTLRLPVAFSLHISMMSSSVIPLEVQRTSPSKTPHLTSPLTTLPSGRGDFFALVTSDSVFVMVRVMLRVRVGLRVRVRLQVRVRVITQGS